MKYAVNNNPIKLLQERGLKSDSVFFYPLDADKNVAFNNPSNFTIIECDNISKSIVFEILAID